MKKTLSIVYALVYFVLTAGLPVTIHYCHGSVASVSIIVPEKSCCCGGNSLSHGCCRNEHLILKADTDNQLVSTGYEVRYFDTGLIIESDNTDMQSKDSGHSLPDHFSGIPPPHQVPRWLAYCSLIYFG
jgi:hypothetical protein